MIQRIQTIFLILVAILGVVFSFIPILGYEFQNKIFIMKAYNSIAMVDGSIVFKNMGVGFIANEIG